MYTTLHIVPVDRMWLPPRPVLSRLLEFFNPLELKLAQFDEPLTMSDVPPEEMNRFDGLSVSETLDELDANCAVCSLLTVECLLWSRSMEASITKMVPESVAAGFVAWDVHMTVGQRAVPDLTEAHKLFDTMFDLTISGDGMPHDLRRYLELVLRTPELIELQRFLPTVSAVEWQPFISANC